MSPLSERRWFNSRLPQTLVISQFLLYFDAFWGVLGLLGTRLVGGSGLATLYRLLLTGSVVASIYGAYGIANEMRRGYQVAVLAAFGPIAIPAVVLLLDGSLLSNLGAVLIPGSVLNAVFVYALIALLLHPQSRDHQRVWFS